MVILSLLQWSDIVNKMKNYLSFVLSGIFVLPAYGFNNNSNYTITKPMSIELEGKKYEGRIRMVVTKDRTSLFTELKKNEKYEKISEMRDDNNDETVDYVYQLNDGNSMKLKRDDMSEETMTIQDASFAQLKISMRKR